MRMIRHHTDEGQYLAAVLKEDEKFIYLKYCNSPGTKKIALSEERYFTDMGEATPDQLSRIMSDRHDWSNSNEKTCFGESKSNTNKCIGGEEEEGLSQESNQQDTGTLA